jgi:DNA-binding beta-propeller fold protein YncE
MNESKTLCRIVAILLYGSLNFNCNSQVANNPVEKEKLSLVSKIALPNVIGRIDHISFDSTNHFAFIAALGNNSVEVVNIDTKQVVHTITGLHEPQGVFFIPLLKKLVVANGDNGDCLFFDAVTYAFSGVVHLKSDADNIRYDAISQLIYVGYGNGGIAIIDANSMKQVGEIPLDGHPESFQLSSQESRIYVNVPDADEIEVADLSTKKVIAKWQNKGASSNFPMALDEGNNRLFIGCRSPAKLRVMNRQTGENIFTVACSVDADDVFYDMKDSLVFVSAGKGVIDVFRTSERELRYINQITTSSGARTSLLLNSEKKFLLAVPARRGNPAALWIYKID